MYNFLEAILNKNMTAYADCTFDRMIGGTEIPAEKGIGTIKSGHYKHIIPP